tara:strand:+ start:297 stop:452 length:156 start_codon:yes stop_codon:yes gene_type:complete
MNNIQEQYKKISQDLKDFDIAQSIINKLDDIDMLYSLGDQLLIRIKEHKRK